MSVKRGHKDPTCDEAVGAADKEWQRMVKLALQIREGRMRIEAEEKYASSFTGIFKRLLTDPIDELKKEIRR